MMEVDSEVDSEADSEAVAMANAVDPRIDLRRHSRSLPRLTGVCGYDEAASNDG